MSVSFSVTLGIVHKTRFHESHDFVLTWIHAILTAIFQLNLGYVVFLPILRLYIILS